MKSSFLLVFGILFSSQAFSNKCYIEYKRGWTKNYYEIFRIKTKSCGFECRYGEKVVLRTDISENELAYVKSNLSGTCTSFEMYKPRGGM